MNDSWFINAVLYPSPSNYIKLDNWHRFLTAILGSAITWTGYKKKTLYNIYYIYYATIYNHIQIM